MSMKSKTASKAEELALEALRSHYLDQVAEYEQLATSARSQLDHVEALMNPILATPVRHFDTASIKPSKSPSSPASNSKPDSKANSKANSKATTASGPVATPPPASAPAKPAKTPKPAAKAPKMAAITKAPGKGKRAAIAVEKQATAPKAASKGKGGRSGKLKMKDTYAGQTMLDAIGMVLQANAGKAVSADSVVNSLYGVLSDDQFRIAKDRVTKSLSKGKIDDKWDRVPNQLGVYTLSLSSLK